MYTIHIYLFVYIHILTCVRVWGFESWVLGFGVGISGFGFSFLGFEFCVLGVCFGFWILTVGPRRVNMSFIRQSRPKSGIGFQVEENQSFEVVPSCSKAVGCRVL